MLKFTINAIIKPVYVYALQKLIFKWYVGYYNSPQTR